MRRTALSVVILGLLAPPVATAEEAPAAITNGGWQVQGSLAVLWVEIRHPPAEPPAQVRFVVETADWERELPGDPAATQAAPSPEDATGGPEGSGGRGGSEAKMRTSRFTAAWNASHPARWVAVRVGSDAGSQDWQVPGAPWLDLEAPGNPYANSVGPAPALLGAPLWAWTLCAAGAAGLLWGWSRRAR